MAISTLALVAESWRRTCVVGHRGAAATHPENTMPAFEEGIACGADAIECDIHVSKDGELVIMHDARLDRTTDLKGTIADTQSSDLKAAGIPFLRELTPVTKERTVLIVELKGGDDVDRKAVEHLVEQGLTDQSIVFSFDSRHLDTANQINPHLFTVHLLSTFVNRSNLDPIFDRLVACGADGVGVDFRNCPAEFVAEAHDRGFPVFVWTVPPGTQVDRLRSLNVNFIITDHPREVVRQTAAPSENAQV